MKQFRLLAAQEPLDVPLAALHIARILAYPNLDIPACLDALKDLTLQARGNGIDLVRHDDRAEALAQFIYHQAAIRGDVLNYSDPRNSFLNDVLTRGLGIPILLSIVYIRVASNLGLNAFGVGLPGHFIVGVGSQHDAIYIDPFNGKRVSGRDCARLVRETTGYTGIFQTDWLQPTSNRDIVLRVLNNLRGIFMRDEAWHDAEKTLSLIECLSPNMALARRDRALIALAQRDYLVAAEKLDAFMRENPNGINQADLRLSVAPLIEKWASLN